MKKKHPFSLWNRFGVWSLFLFLLGGLPVYADGIPRKQLFDENWKFSLGDYPDARDIDYNDDGWRILSLPHDWSVEGCVGPDEPMGNDGGYFPSGVAWYRKTFEVPVEYAGRKIGIYFEGVYMNSEVFINGHSLGVRPYGYSSFFYDMTPYLRFGEENVMAVRVDNSGQKNCRWYTGSGIYRHVWLIQTAPVHIAHWGTFITTPKVDAAQATVQIVTQLENESPATRRVTLSTRLTYDGMDKGNETTDVEIPAGGSLEVTQNIPVATPALWSPDFPNLYVAHCTVSEGEKSLDEVTQTFGIRTIAYSAEKGFLLNGKPMKIFGGCLHHDNGVLGAAAYDRAEERKAEMMKAAGFNAVRTSHNIPSEAFLDACDRVGLLVIDESFDGWRDAKNKMDYSIYFDEWWEKDVTTMVLRDRNHPSILCWSTGNEVIERKKLEVVTTAQKLKNAIHKYDTTRPVLSALAAWDSDWEIYDPLAAVHDIIGYNYLLDRAPADHKRVPSRMIIQTESYPRDAFKNWALVNDNSYILGDFVWTSIDYLGESGIGRYYYEGESEGEHYHRNQYPWHGAYCGDIDLTGWRKPISYYRELLFNPSRKLYLAVKEPDGYYGKIRETLWSVWPTWESWNWPGHEGKPIEVEIYSRYPKVRLYLDDQLIGEQPTEREQQFKAVFTLSYRPGALNAVGIENGKEVESQELSTSGAPAQIRLTPDRKKLKANGQDLSFVVVEVLDSEGNVVPDADNLLTFELKGRGTIAAVGNADSKDTDKYVGNQRKAWKGRAIVVLKSGTKTGRIRLKATAPGLKSASVNVQVEKAGD